MLLPARSRDPLLPAMRPGRGPLVESYFLKANCPTRREAIWVKHTFLVPPDGARGRASVWAVHFDGDGGSTHAFKETWPIGAVTCEPDRLDLAFGDCTLSGGRARGRLRDDEGSIAWDLTFDDPSPPLHAIHPLLSRGPVPRMKIASPMPDATFDGRFAIDGEERPAAGWRGMLGHNWGPRHNILYAWAHCNTFDAEPGTVLEAVTGKIRIAGIDTPMLVSLSLRRHGRQYDLHSVHAIGRRTSDVSFQRWFFSVTEPPVRIEGVIQGARDETVGLYYDNPDGTMTYCLNTKIAHARIFLYEEGCPDTVLSTRTAALEIGTDDPHHGVRMAV